MTYISNILYILYTYNTLQYILMYNIIYYTYRRFLYKICCLIMTMANLYLLLIIGYKYIPVAVRVVGSRFLIAHCIDWGAKLVLCPCPEVELQIKIIEYLKYTYKNKNNIRSSF